MTVCGVRSKAGAHILVVWMFLWLCSLCFSLDLKVKLPTDCQFILKKCRKVRTLHLLTLLSFAKAFHFPESQGVMKINLHVLV
jgi:hypothetical protein